MRDQQTSFLLLFSLCSCFRFLSTHSFPPPCRLALAVGNKLSCWHFLFAFLHREIPQTPLFNLLWKSPTHCTGSRATSLFLKLIPSTVHILSIYFHKWDPKRCWGKKMTWFCVRKTCTSSLPTARAMQRGDEIKRVSGRSVIEAEPLCLVTNGSGG